MDPKSLREQLRLSDPVDTQSIGFLRFVLRLSEALNLDLPQQEHPRLATLAGCYDFIAQATSGHRAGLGTVGQSGLHVRP